jgi:hypothetical protein
MTMDWKLWNHKAKINLSYFKLIFSGILSEWQKAK